jgi:hypothetical protein
MKSRLIAALMCASWLVAPVIVSAQDDSLEQLVIEMAHTRAEHTAVARHYMAKAEEARSEMRRHEKMANAYGSSKTTQPQRMRNHCLDLAKKYGEIAADYDDLAKLHQEEAQKAAE